jgi:murein DD-endopeptidase MepM/ murein hydrolase activator NlpD
MGSRKRPFSRGWFGMLTKDSVSGFLRCLARHFLLASICLLGIAPVGPASAAPVRSKRKNATSEQLPASSRQARSPSPAQLRAERLGLGTRRAAGELLAGRVAENWLRSTGDTKPPSTLKFPVAKGWFVRGFGSGAGGYHQAMDIGGAIGSNVRAAASGLVGYAGNELSGYGNLVILIHTGGFVTTYAHNSKNRVVAGQRVERGQVIAELGSTGKSRGPHVHFEFLHAGQNCDPAGLFRRLAHPRPAKSTLTRPKSGTVRPEPGREPRARFEGCIALTGLPFRDGAG